ncbi:hypothetical protein PGT21_018211 [Puccinia graminis f. sp. tritici]|uniref:ATP-dependent DNA helicase sgs1 n=1 Tax=Puccinia graminis f. sp. tritici TaxID=56615 RepID=A0A5B0LYV6_PUCGR|nr:hypothetical protein PGT21_018211 [Puccinia graminis f. sp. tritici]
MGSNSEDSAPPGTPQSPLQDLVDPSKLEPSFPVERDSRTPASSLSKPDFDKPLFTNENNATNPEAALLDNFTALKKQALELYGDEAKDEQVEVVAALVHGLHTFVLAGTGFGKTQIAEMYHNLFQPDQKVILLVVNPLDSLGDHQV